MEEIRDTSWQSVSAEVQRAALLQSRTTTVWAMRFDAMLSKSTLFDRNGMGDNAGAVEGLYIYPDMRANKNCTIRTRDVSRGK